MANGIRLTTLLISLLLSALTLTAQRRVSPVTSRDPGTAAPITDLKKAIDPSRLVTTVDAQGNTVTVDTVTGLEYVDTTKLETHAKMEYPLIHEAILGVNVWDPLMRALGQKYGLGDVWGELSIHNRYFPFFAIGIGNCKDTPIDKNYTFETPAAPYFKIGASYNFFYNSKPDYRLQMGLRYGFSTYKWRVYNVTVDEGYWGEPSQFSLGKLSHTAGYLEISLGIKVKIADRISAGWTLIYHSVLHESSSPYGQPMYIPGYGKRNGAFTANLSIMYTLPINKDRKKAATDEAGLDEESADPAINERVNDIAEPEKESIIINRE